MPALFRRRLGSVARSWRTRSTPGAAVPPPGWRRRRTPLEQRHVGPLQQQDEDPARDEPRSEEHTSELQSLMRNSYAVFCLKKKKHKENTIRQSKNTTRVIKII